MNEQACEKCDRERRVSGQVGRVGTPCDICAGRRWDYLGRPCRHCQPAAPGSTAATPTDHGPV